MLYFNPRVNQVPIMYSTCLLDLPKTVFSNSIFSSSSFVQSFAQHPSPGYCAPDSSLSLISLTSLGCCDGIRSMSPESTRDDSFQAFPPGSTRNSRITNFPFSRDLLHYTNKSWTASSCSGYGCNHLLNNNAKMF